jgi:hypothetical protein
MMVRLAAYPHDRVNTALCHNGLHLRKHCPRKSISGEQVHGREQ